MSIGGGGQNYSTGTTGNVTPPTQAPGGKGGFPSIQSPYAQQSPYPQQVAQNPYAQQNAQQQYQRGYMPPMFEPGSGGMYGPQPAPQFGNAYVRPFSQPSPFNTSRMSPMEANPPPGEQQYAGNYSPQYSYLSGRQDGFIQPPSEEIRRPPELLPLSQQTTAPTNNQPPPGYEINPDYIAPNPANSSDSSSSFIGSAVMPDSKYSSPFRPTQETQDRVAREIANTPSFEYFAPNPFSASFGPTSSEPASAPAAATRGTVSSNVNNPAYQQQLAASNMTDYQRLMRQQQMANQFQPSQLGIGGLQQNFRTSAPTDFEIAKSLGWKDPHAARDMLDWARDPMAGQVAKERAEQSKAYLNSIGYGQAGFDPSKYEVKREPVSRGPSSGLGALLGAY